MIKFFIKKILSFFGWSLIKINRKPPKSYVYEKPSIEVVKCFLNSKGILHLGAHRGKEAEVYNWFNKKVIWIEANPEMYDDLKNHTRYFYKQKAYNYLIGEKNKKNKNFFISNKDASCSSIYNLSDEVKKKKLWKEHNVKILNSIQLEMKTLDDIFRQNQINIREYNHWVVDLQGAELNALMGAKKSLKSCKSINVEISMENYYESGSTKWNDLKKFLIKKGFKLVTKPQKKHCDALFKK